jgi:hypothetical protein
VADFASPPKLENGNFDREQVKELYLQSKHLEWTDFARSRGWNPQVTRTAFPIRSWKNTKKRILAKQHAEEFESLSFDQIALWKKEVIRTMRYYPESIENVKFLADVKINSMLREIQLAQRENRPPVVNLGDLEKCSVILSRCVQDKHKALLLNQISLKIAQEPMLNPSQGAITGDEKMVGFTAELAGTNRSISELAAEVAKYYDRPTPDEIQRDVSPPAAPGDDEYEDET